MTTAIRTSQNSPMIANDVLNRATVLLEGFTELKIRLDQMSPADQFINVKENKAPYEGRKLSEMAEILNEMQNQVSTHGQLSENEQKLISKKLHASASLLDCIYGNCVYAQRVVELSKVCEQIFQNINRANIDPKEVKALRTRIIGLKSQHGINAGNKNALEQMEATLLTAIESSQVYPSSITFIASPKSGAIDPQAQEIFDRLKQMEASPITNAHKQEIFSSILAILDRVPTASKTSSSRDVLIDAKVDPIQELQALLAMLQKRACSTNDLVAHLTTLKSKESKSFFQMSSSNSFENVVDRISFHLYYIHRKERHWLVHHDDPNYGYNAMIGVCEASNSERHRAILRTIAELALQKLEDAVTSNRIEEIVQTLKIIEELKMNMMDMPLQQTNLAHLLFHQMYNRQVEARKTNSSLINPQDKRFNREFGRKAFPSTEGMDPAVKIAAVNAVRLILKQVWKIS